MFAVNSWKGSNWFMFLIYIQWMLYGSSRSQWLLLNTSLAMVNLENHTHKNLLCFIFSYEINIRMKTVNGGDMMRSNHKSSKISAADRSYLPFFFFFSLPRILFQKTFKVSSQSEKNNIIQNRWLIQNYLNEPKWKGWNVYKQRKMCFLLQRSSRFAKRNILETYSYPCKSFTTKKQMFGDRL